MASPLFEFFEAIADELSSDPSRIITRDSLRINDEEPLLLDELKRAMKAVDSADAMQKAVQALAKHFEARDSNLPFSYDPVSGRFTATDHAYLTFVRTMRQIRSIGGKSRTFECSVAQRLGERTTGNIHRVGHPRDRKKKKSAFNHHLRRLGFEEEVLLGKEKDGGFDIMWMLPLGAVPHRPLVSLQCKNGEFDIGEADASLGAARRSFSRHEGLLEPVHVPCVVFNDYISKENLTKKQLNFVPLGLTDLAAIDRTATVEMI